MSEGVFQGSLFSSDFLWELIGRLPDWSALDDVTLETLRLDLRRVFDRFPTAQTPNESQTEDDLIWPILARLGWTESLRQQNSGSARPGGRTGRAAVQRRCVENAGQHLPGGVAALRVRPGRR